MLLNQTVRSLFTPAGRKKFETRVDAAACNLLNPLISSNLTKMAVVQLRERKSPQRGPKQPETGV
jgi:hypothetical protein